MEIRSKGYPLHRHITREETQQKLSQYLLVTAGQMALQETSFANARKGLATVWDKISKVREAVEQDKRDQEALATVDTQPDALG